MLIIDYFLRQRPPPLLGLGGEGTSFRVVAIVLRLVARGK